jgi:hypothetical protein
VKPATLVAAIVWCACTPPGEDGPRLLAVIPPQGASAAAVEIHISGENLAPRVATDFADRRKSSLDATFSARLFDTPLSDVRLTPDGALAATVPAGLSEGVYDLEVIDPAGTEATLAQAYRVVTSAENVASFRFDELGPQRAGVSFALGLTAIDSTGRTVDGFDGTVTLSDRSGTLQPTTVGPLVLGRLRGAIVSITGLREDEAITAIDLLGHAGTSNVFSVRPGLPVSLVFVTAPQSLVAGQCSAAVELETRDARGVVALLESSTSVGLSGSAGLTFYSDEGCASAVTSLLMRAGQSRAGFRYRAERAGAVLVIASPDAFPSATQPQTVAPGAPSRIEFSTPSHVVAKDVCSGVTRVRVVDALGNPSPQPQASSLGLEAVPVGGLSFFSDAACSTPVASVPVAAGAAESSFYFRASSPGMVTLKVTGASLGAASRAETIGN